MTEWHVDKLMTYMAALTLFIDDYEVDLFDLQEDLRLDTKKYVLSHIFPPPPPKRNRLVVNKNLTY